MRWLVGAYRAASGGNAHVAEPKTFPDGQLEQSSVSDRNFPAHTWTPFSNMDTGSSNLLDCELEQKRAASPESPALWHASSYYVQSDSRVTLFCMENISCRHQLLFPLSWLPIEAPSSSVSIGEVCGFDLTLVTGQYMHLDVPQ